MSVNLRILQLRKYLKLNQTEFGKKIGLTQTSLSTIEKNKSVVTKQTFIAICSEFNVNPVWLKTGNGEMFKISKKFDDFFEIYKNLNPVLQDFLSKTVLNLLECQNDLQKPSKE